MYFTATPPHLSPLRSPRAIAFTHTTIGRARDGHPRPPIPQARRSRARAAEPKMRRAPALTTAFAASDRLQGGDHVFGNVRQALRHRNFAYYWVGQTASITGNGIFRVALPLEVLHLTGSVADLGFVLAADQGPMILLLLLGGVIVDRFSRRSLMLLADAAAGLATLLVGVAIATGHIHLWSLFALSVLMGAANAIYFPASAAIMPDLLPAEDLGSGNSLISMSQSLGQYLAGPLLGGVIVAVSGAALGYEVDGATFLFSALALSMIRGVVSRGEGGGTSMIEEIRAGLRYTLSRRWLSYNMTAVSLVNMLSYIPMLVVVPLLVSDDFHAGSDALGVVYAASGLGGALASLLLPQPKDPRTRLTVMWIAIAAGTASVAFMGLAPKLWIAVVFSGVLWGGATYGNLLYNTLMQERIPPRLLGRVASVDVTVGLSTGPLGFLLGGLVAGAVGARTTLVVGGLVAVSLSLVAFVPGVLDPDAPPRGRHADLDFDQEAEFAPETVA
jgi:DHA3 family tetracycline resistance protein-like MFS transporter